MQNSTVLELHTFVSNGGHALAGDEALLVLGAKASATLSVAIVAGSVELAAHVYSIVEETYRVVTGGLSHQSEKCDGRKLQPTCQAKKVLCSSQSSQHLVHVSATKRKLFSRNSVPNNDGGLSQFTITELVQFATRATRVAFATSFAANSIREGETSAAHRSVAKIKRHEAATGE